jgi:hypothetical protein
VPTITPPAARHRARLRSRARRFGFGIRKSRTRAGEENGGGFQLYDLETGDVVAGARFDLDVAELEAAVNDRATDS